MTKAKKAARKRATNEVAKQVAEDLLATLRSAVVALNIDKWRSVDDAILNCPYHNYLEKLMLRICHKEATTALKRPAEADVAGLQRRLHWLLSTLELLAAGDTAWSDRLSDKLRSLHRADAAAGADGPAYMAARVDMEEDEAGYTIRSTTEIWSELLSLGLVSKTKAFYHARQDVRWPALEAAEEEEDSEDEEEQLEGALALGGSGGLEAAAKAAAREAREAAEARMEAQQVGVATSAQDEARRRQAEERADAAHREGNLELAMAADLEQWELDQQDEALAAMELSRRAAMAAAAALQRPAPPLAPPPPKHDPRLGPQQPHSQPSQPHTPDQGSPQQARGGPGSNGGAGNATANGNGNGNEKEAQLGAPADWQPVFADAGPTTSQRDHMATRRRELSQAAHNARFTIEELVYRDRHFEACARDRLAGRVRFRDVVRVDHELQLYHKVMLCRLYGSLSRHVHCEGAVTLATNAETINLELQLVEWGAGWVQDHLSYMLYGVDPDDAEQHAANQRLGLAASSVLRALVLTGPQQREWMAVQLGYEQREACQAEPGGAGALLDRTIRQLVEDQLLRVQRRHVPYGGVSGPDSLEGCTLRLAAREQEVAFHDSRLMELRRDQRDR
ncbi:hypothetical protein HYH03_018644 [Edaphochlamys debaryana]|uniref:Uncharacterized protein n=1 Tax=Edaphochlamys debaryana TaxID=47281 RepID=A0A835XGL2_9CHLO|nr:hypothetical protein HYH03_018644 [Edaphochlamys debaryana]|eukprot:KAG2482408.1 hypothetical protein HYH03_018644 [Edaphochlamys debaryana]